MGDSVYKDICVKWCVVHATDLHTQLLTLGLYIASYATGRKGGGGYYLG